MVSLVHEIEDAPLLCALFTLTGFTSPHTRVLTIRDEQGHPGSPGRECLFSVVQLKGSASADLMFQSPLRTHVLALLELEHKACRW